MGDWVWLCLFHRPVRSLEPRAKGKLGPHFAGPFQLLERVGIVLYRLKLLDGTRLHDVFHVGMLKPHKGDHPTSSTALPPTHDGRLLPAPDHALRAQLRRGTWFILVKWQGLSKKEGT